jgi:hypothetical protein
MLGGSEWTNVLNCTEADKAYENFAETLSNAFNTSFPLVQQSRKSYKDKKWITPALRISIRHKNRLYKKYLTKPNPNNEAAYKRYKNKLLVTIDLAKRAYYSEKLASDKAKLNDIWRIYSELLGRSKNSQGPELSKLIFNGQTHTSSSAIANAFNQYFATIGADLAKQHNSPTSHKMYLNYPLAHNMFVAPISPDEVKLLIQNLSAQKAAGIDDFNAKTIKIALPFILDSLTHVYNLSFSQGCVPKKLKISKVIPIFKKKEKFLPVNYRPISLLSIFDKILEKLMHKRLYSFLTKHEILYDYQFGFRSQHSTTLAIVEIVDNIRNDLDKSNHVLGLYLDLSKAFDCVDHAILIDKLSHYGIRGLALEWFKSYLRDCSKKTYVNNTYSNACPVNTGVPQGSVLGPILFLIYVNDIANCINQGKIRLFADDTNLFFSDKSIPTLQSQANSALANLYKWFSANKLTLNSDKTCYTLFSNSNVPPIELFLNGHAIKQVSETKYLGMHLDDKLNWKCHINCINSKLSQLTGAFRYLASYIKPANAKQIYYAYVFPYIKYGIEVYGTCDPSIMKSLQISQNKSLKLLTNRERHMHNRSV